MIAKEAERELAISLRLKGLTYNEILEQVPVAKSTLSLWLRSVGLAKVQKQRLTLKRIEAQKKGAEAKRSIRMNLQKEIYDFASKEISSISKRELWLIGTALYWAEGSKEKSYRPGNSLTFMNSDPNMVKIYLRWLKEVCGISEEDIVLDIYIHENHRDNLDRVREYWSQVTSILAQDFRIYFKRNKINTKRRNVDENYFGILRIVVRSSSTLLRRVTGWTIGIHKTLIES